MALTAARFWRRLDEKARRVVEWRWAVVFEKRAA